MSYTYLLTDIQDGVLIITINREKKLNALKRDLIQELSAAFKAYENDNSVKGVVLIGAGPKAFAAGADISEFTGLSSAEGEKMSKSGHDVFNSIESYSKPVIAAINGFALGAGCELAMACHLRVASENARFGQPEVNLGLIPGYGGTQRLIQLIGKGKAMELLMTGDMIKANEALSLGLVNYVVPTEELIGKCKEIIAKIAKKAPLAIAQVIKTVDAYFTDGVNGYDAEIKAFGTCCNTEDFTEGANAFLEKRAANFKGK